MNALTQWQWWLLEKREIRFNDGRGTTVLKQVQDSDERGATSIVRMSPQYEKTNDRLSEAVVHRVVWRCPWLY